MTPEGWRVWGPLVPHPGPYLTLRQTPREYLQHAFGAVLTAPHSWSTIPLLSSPTRPLFHCTTLFPQPHTRCTLDPSPPPRLITAVSSPQGLIHTLPSPGSLRRWDVSPPSSEPYDFCVSGSDSTNRLSLHRLEGSQEEDTRT